MRPPQKSALDCRPLNRAWSAHPDVGSVTPVGDEEGVPGLCGRDRELAELLAALHAANSRTRAVFVGGAAGVGKTRLVSELVGIARQRGTTVLTGHAIDIVDAPPFWPVVSAIRNAARSESDDATASLMNRWLAELPLAAGLDDSGLRPSIRLLDSLHQLIVELAAVRPLVLVVEDLQWADRSTRDLLVYLVASLSHETVLIIGTYRDDSPGQASGLNAVLAELRRQRKVSGLELGLSLGRRWPSCLPGGRRGTQAWNHWCGSVPPAMPSLRRKRSAQFSVETRWDCRRHCVRSS